MLSCRSKRAEGSCLGQAQHGTAAAEKPRSSCQGQVLRCSDWERRGLLLRSQGQPCRRLLLAGAAL